MTPQEVAMEGSDFRKDKLNLHTEHSHSTDRDTGIAFERYGSLGLGLAYIGLRQNACVRNTAGADGGVAGRPSSPSKSPERTPGCVRSVQGQSWTLSGRWTRPRRIRISFWILEWLLQQFGIEWRFMERFCEWSGIGGCCVGVLQWFCFAS
nr:uncharacterized protein LOC113810953 [Penaeus vannamei]